MTGRDITDEIVESLSISSPFNVSYANSTFWYDYAIAGEPFLSATSDARPYQRALAPISKQQFDNSADPGEQSLTGWWLRSQSSFHRGAGIKYYDPSAGEEVQHRFTDSRNVDVWTPGQVTLLRKMNAGHITTNGQQWLRSIKDGATDAVLMLDGHDIDKVYADGSYVHFVDYNSGIEYPVYAFCDDGQFAFWVTQILDSGTDKLVMYKKLLTDDATDADTEMFKNSSILPADGRTVMEFVKNRIILANKNAIYELTPSSTSLPTALYTHPTSTWTFSAIAESGAAIYVAGYSGTQSNILKFALSSTGTLPTLGGGNVVAEMPAGEQITALYGYLGYLLIGTTSGMRVAQIDQNGDLIYGPLIFESDYPVYDFACRDRFAYVAAGVGTEIGVRRVDLSAQIAPLQFAWANDHMVSGVIDSTTGVAFIGNSDRLAIAAPAQNKTATITSLSANGTSVTYTVANSFKTGDKVNVLGMVPNGYNAFGATVTSANGTSFTIAKTQTGAVTTYGYANLAGNIYVEDETEFVDEGYVETGRIRYGTLEPKLFKRLRIRGTIPTDDTITASSIDRAGTEYNLFAYNSTLVNAETLITPVGAQDWLSFKFVLRSHDGSTTPVFSGYQVKSLPAVTRSELIRLHLMCFDFERDKFGVMYGNDGSAAARYEDVRNLVRDGDIVRVQDLNTGESVEAIIDDMQFEQIAPPSPAVKGFGGIISVIARTVT